MRVNRLSVFLHAVVLCLANLALVCGLGALLTDAGPYLVAAGFLGALVFLLAGSEHRWRFPWWGSLGLACVVIVLAVWIEHLDYDPNSLHAYGTSNLLPLIYLFLTVQALLLVKLTGPSTPFDFWIEQSVGLVFVLFACGVCKNPWFSAVLLAYIGLGVVAVLAQHFRRRQDAEPICRGRVTVRPLQAARLEPVGMLRPRGVLFWGLIVLPLVLLLFFCVPRPDLAFGDGISFEDGMDLNKKGPVKLSEQTAFTVTVTNGRQRFGSFDTDQHWRCEVLTRYARGRWSPPPAGRRVNPIDPQWRRTAALPGDREFDFTVVLGQAGGLPLADPVAEMPARITYTSTPSLRFPGLYPETATFAHVTVPKNAGAFEYTQNAAVGDDPDRVPAPLYDETDDGMADRRSVPPGVRAYTTTLLADLIDKQLYGLHEGDYEGADNPEAPASVRGARVARALTAYLNSSRAFAYTLDRPRGDTSIDPTEDFLVNTRQGHCERFAGALALMLRSQGVPARVVVGYRGWHPQQGNTYVVRQSDAHAWVEALVPPKHSSFCAAAGIAGCEPWLNECDPEWLSLEPTTSWVAPPPPKSGGWFSSFLASISSWWSGPRSGGGGGIHLNPISFDGHIQGDLFGWSAANLPYLLVVALVLAVLVYLARYVRQWAGLPTSAATVTEPFYQRLLQLLAWHRGLEPQPAQTPREFGAAVGQVLEAEPKTQRVAALPGWIVELYYRVRFGGQPLAANERTAVEGRLEELRAGLKGK